MTLLRSALRSSCAALGVAAVVLAGCGESADKAPSATAPAETEPVETAPEAEVVARIAPFLSSVASADEFEPDAYELFWSANRVVETDAAREAFVERVGGPSDALLDIDLAEQFVVVMTSGSCVIPASPPDLVIEADEAYLDQLPDDIECYAPLNVIQFYAVDVGLRDHIVGALTDLSYAISTRKIVTSESAPDLVERIVAPTWVDTPADAAVLAAEITDDAVRPVITDFSHQPKLLVPVQSCDPGTATHRILIDDDLRFTVVGDTETACAEPVDYLAVFWLNDERSERIVARSPEAWSHLADGVEVSVPVGPNTSWSEPGPEVRLDEVESHVITTAESLATSTLASEYDVALADVDLANEFLVIIVRRDCDRVDDDGIVIEDERWILVPPLSVSLDCETPDVAMRGFVVAREHIGLFADLPEGQGV